MPIDYRDYPSNWKTEIRPAILERAGHKCEQCQVPNHAIITRAYGEWIDDMGVRHNERGEVVGMIRGSDMWSEDEKQYKPVRIVLTISHTDHDITNNDPSNLLALCQKCHNAHDGKYRAKNAANTRRRKYIQQTGQMELGTPYEPPRHTPYGDYRALTKG